MNKNSRLKKNKYKKKIIGKYGHQSGLQFLISRTNKYMYTQLTTLDGSHTYSTIQCLTKESSTLAKKSVEYFFSNIEKISEHNKGVDRSIMPLLNKTSKKYHGHIKNFIDTFKDEFQKRLK